VRIVAGIHRGRALTSLGKGDAGAHLRPTTDRVRESLFGVLTGGRFGDPVTDAHVLDLFAGTGALGLEALSRGAAHVTFADSGRKAQTLIRQNISLLKADAQCTLFPRDARRLPPAPHAANLVFLDPPYGKSLGNASLLSAQAQGWLASNALIVWEESTPQTPPEGFDLCETRAYGDSHITLLTAPA
jgi:16S rRNA (guanine966-N2)-methyltransferase